jgi:FHA domain
VTTPDSRTTTISKWGTRAVFAVAIFAVCTAAAEPANAAVGDTTAIVMAWLWNAPVQIKTFMTAAYDKAPALVLVLGALFVMPMTALIAYTAMSMRDRLPRAALRGWRGHGPDRMTRRSARSAPVTIAAWPANAWLSIDGGARMPLPKTSGLARIGRHDDNDIRLPETSVHRHHAIVHRTAAAEFVITDLSGAGGNGIIVNGKRVAQAQLFSGDVIELGSARLTFESTPV